MIEAGCHSNGTPFDPEMDETEYYDKCEPDSKIVGAIIKQELELIPGPIYSDDDYKFIDHTDPQYDGVQHVRSDGRTMPHEMVETEYEFFTGSNDSQCWGYNPEPEKVFPAVEREYKRQPSSIAPSKKARERLECLMVTVYHKRRKGSLPRAVFGSRIGFCQIISKSIAYRLLVGNESELGCRIVMIVVL